MGFMKNPVLGSSRNPALGSWVPGFLEEPSSEHEIHILGDWLDQF
ncbi:hypothetical protein SLEP1_g17769 [Rubroshorea leprosula]|uniref:Uncharacterized protein n=1 Tax=Rubroshorea leprosula TaxID=152421 RepID=A0AAV5J5Y2_9ROSI|nr:hypothetical protein SLEP1_g17769 [Rubroshorea leprosula]